MEKKVCGMKKFFAEFKKFITRGNVLDLAVGVIIGGAFTAIVNALSNNILKPLINWLITLVLGEKGLAGAITFLSKVLATDGTIDLTSSIFIDWGAVVSAIINFILTAFVLFIIVRTMNRFSEAQDRMRDGWNFEEKKELAKIRYEQKISKKQAKAILEEKKAEIAAQKAEEARLAEEKAKEEARLAEEKATANTRLLEEIRDLLKQAR